MSRDTCRFVLQLFVSLEPGSVERISDFCNPNQVHYFHCEIQSDPTPVARLGKQNNSSFLMG